MTKVRNWIREMTVRFEELEERIQAERDSLSAFRKGEAMDLALTDAEAKEWRLLRSLLDYYETTVLAY